MLRPFYSASAFCSGGFLFIFLAHNPSYFNFRPLTKIAGRVILIICINMPLHDAPAEHLVGGINEICVYKFYFNQRVQIRFPKVLHGVLLHVYYQVV